MDPEVAERRAMARGRLMLLATVAIWGWTFVATKICLEVLAPVELLALRFAVALPVLGVLLRLRKVAFAPLLRQPSIALGAVFAGLHFWVQVTGLQYTTATNTGWIIAVTPLVMAVVAAVVLGERLGGRGVLGIAVSTGGILLLVSGGSLASLGWLDSKGDWLVLASAHTWAFYTVAVRPALRRFDPQAVTLAVLLPGALAMLGLTAVDGCRLHLLELPWEVVLALLFLAIPGTAAAHWMWQIGVARVGAAQAGLFLYLEPVATMTLAVPLLGEPLTAASVGGGMLVLGGVWVATRRP